MTATADTQVMTPPPTTRWPIKVRCRDGRLTAFDPARIEAAVARAAREVRHAEAPLATTVATAVADILARRPRGEVVDVEAIQDLWKRSLPLRVSTT